MFLISISLFVIVFVVAEKFPSQFNNQILDFKDYLVAINDYS